MMTELYMLCLTDSARTPFGRCNLTKIQVTGILLPCVVFSTRCDNPTFRKVVLG